LIETAHDPYISYLFYGGGGSGKTTTAMNHPGKAKAYLDMDARLHEIVGNLTKQQIESVKLHWTNKELLQGTGDISEVYIDRTRANVAAGSQITVEPKGYMRLLDATNELLRLAKACKKEGKPFPYDLVVADSMTRICDHLSYRVMYRHSATIITDTLYDVVKRNLKEWLMGFLSLPCDRIIIAHTKHVEKRDKNTNALLMSFTKPLVTGSMAEEMVTFFTEAYYFKGRKQGTAIYQIQTSKDSETDARTARKLAMDEDLKLLPTGQVDVSRIFNAR
jgi:hypothetical protein